MSAELQMPMHVGNVHEVTMVDPDGKISNGWMGMCYFHHYTRIYASYADARNALNKHFQTKAAPHLIG